MNLNYPSNRDGMNPLSGPKTNDPLMPRASKEEGMNQGPRSKPGKRKIAIVIAIIASVAIAGTYFGIVYFSQSACPSGVALRSFVIIANDTTGYNNSRYEPFQMNVHRGVCVLVTFINNSTTQSHGLVISYYDATPGIIVQPAKSGNIKFLATQTGQFSLFEQIYSTIADWTSNAGTLNVT